MAPETIDLVRGMYIYIVASMRPGQDGPGNLPFISGL